MASLTNALLEGMTWWQDKWLPVVRQVQLRKVDSASEIDIYQSRSRKIVARKLISPAPACFDRLGYLFVEDRPSNNAGENAVNHRDLQTYQKADIDLSERAAHEARYTGGRSVYCRAVEVAILVDRFRSTSAETQGANIHPCELARAEMTIDCIKHRKVLVREISAIQVLMFKNQHVVLWNAYPTP